MSELRNKGRLRKKLWILLACGVALVLLLTLWREREPRYGDRSLLQWIAIAQHPDNDPDYSKRDAEEAIRHIGTNAVPFLIKCIEYHERPWQTRLGALCSKLPEKIGEPLSGLVAGRGAQRQAAAFSGLSMLGPDAKSAIPALTNLIAAQPLLADDCISVLAEIGDAGLPAILTMLTNQPNSMRRAAVFILAYPDTKFTFNQGIGDILTTRLDDSDRELAYHAAAILCLHHLNENLALRTFADAIEGNDKKLQRMAASILRSYVFRKYEVRTLIQFLHDTNSPFSATAATALGDIPGYKMPDPAIVPALTDSLRDPRAPVRACAAESLGRLDRAAEPAASALLDLWNDPDLPVRRAATNAFLGLPAYSALRDAIVPNHWGPGPIRMSSEQQAMYFQRYGINAVPPPNALLSHPDIRIRQMATNAFRMGNGSNTTENAGH
jgi:HEAT repeat protein